jgi:hypothetical protein
MDEFYSALRASGCDDDDIDIIKTVFQQQRIKVGMVSRLTDADLNEAGLAQVGLCNAVLADTTILLV